MKQKDKQEKELLCQTAEKAGERKTDDTGVA